MSADVPRDGLSGLDLGRQRDELPITSQTLANRFERAGTFVDMPALGEHARRAAQHEDQSGETSKGPRYVSHCAYVEACKISDESAPAEAFPGWLRNLQLSGAIEQREVRTDSCFTPVRVIRRSK